MVRVFPWVSLPIAAYVINYLSSGFWIGRTVFWIPAGDGAVAGLSVADMLVAVGICFLLLELLLAGGRLSLSTIFNHVLSVLVFAACLTLLLAMADSRSSTLIHLTLLAFVDAVGGIWISMRLTHRLISVDPAVRLD
jgi:hypothetical protein